MGNKTAELAVYPVQVFTRGERNFHCISLERILEFHPFLEYPHKQQYYSLLVVEKADGFVESDGVIIRLDEPKTICINQNSVCRLSVNRNARGFIIVFTESFFSLRYNNNVLLKFSYLKTHTVPYFRFSDTEMERWNTFKGFILEELSEQKPSMENVLRSYLNILLNELDRKFQAFPVNKALSSQESRVIGFEKLIEEHFQLHKNPSWYASQLHITTNYLNRLCHAYRGVKSGDLIKKRVLLEAQRLLHYTCLSIAEIAFRLGFESVPYFVTFFRKNMQCTPEAFRKKPSSGATDYPARIDKLND